jgi:hypothetical protein
VRGHAPAKEVHASVVEELFEDAPLPKRSHETAGARAIARPHARRTHEDDERKSFPWVLTVSIGGGAVLVLAVVIGIVFLNTLKDKPDIRARTEGTVPSNYGMSMLKRDEIPPGPEKKPSAAVPPPALSQTAPSNGQNAPEKNSPNPSMPSTPATAVPAPQVPVWKADDALLPYLGEPQTIPGTKFRIRVPKGFTMFQMGGGGPMGGVNIISPNPQQAASAMHFVFSIQPYIGRRQDDTEETEIEFSLRMDKNLHTDWSQSKMERGLINGIVFARVAWTGASQSRGELESGVIYWAIDGRNTIQIEASTDLPPTDPLYRLIDVAILTFERDRPQ